MNVSHLSTHLTTAITNPSFYQGAGEHINETFQEYLDDNGLPGGQAGQSLNSISEIQNAATAIIGRFSQYTANFTFNNDGSLFDAGTPTHRNFATQAYEGYIQDSWRLRPHFTLTLGLRYSLERPVYETKGFEVQPEIPLGTYFENRLAAGAAGGNFTDPIILNKSGPVNGGKPMYDWDKNNFQPRVAVAWSPNYSNGLLHSLFGDAGSSVLRGGFALTNDYFGQALAVDWDLNNTLGFTQSSNINANAYDTTGDLGPLFTGFNQDVRSLPNLDVPTSLQFPIQQPSDIGGRIETGVDSRLHAPNEYVWNFTYERQMRGGTTLSVSYIGRMARSLLARRDATAFNNIRDPSAALIGIRPGQSWKSKGNRTCRPIKLRPFRFSTIFSRQTWWTSSIMIRTSTPVSLQRGRLRRCSMECKAEARTRQTTTPLRSSPAMTGQMLSSRLTLRFLMPACRLDSYSRSMARCLHGARLEIPTTMLSRFL